MHVLNLGGLAGGRWYLAWWWGFWTFFGGLVFGFVREKTGKYCGANAFTRPTASDSLCNSWSLKRQITGGKV